MNTHPPPHNGQQNSTLYENCPMVSNAAGLIIIISCTKGKAHFSFRFPPCRYWVTICGFPNLHSLSVLGVPQQQRSVCPPAMICLAVMWSQCAVSHCPSYNFSWVESHGWKTFSGHISRLNIFLKENLAYLRTKILWIILHVMIIKSTLNYCSKLTIHHKTIFQPLCH